MLVKQGKQAARQAAKKQRQNGVYEPRLVSPPVPALATRRELSSMINTPQGRTAELHFVAFQEFLAERNEPQQAIRQAWGKAKVGGEKKDKNEDAMRDINLAGEESKIGRKKDLEYSSDEDGWDMCRPMLEDMKVVEEEDGWQVVTEVEV